MSETSLTIIPLGGLPMVKPGDDIARLLVEALERGGIAPGAFDILVVTQKIVSKSEGQLVDLRTVEPSARALELARITHKDPRLVELVLSQSVTVVRARPNVLIVETLQGLVMANAGIDQSNLDAGEAGGNVLLLPVDADASAMRIKARLDAHFGTSLGVIISDSVGRAWRLGTVGLAIGAAGVPSLIDRRGEADLAGRPLQTTEVGFADAVAAAAVLVMGEAAEGRPAALVRGLSCDAKPQPAKHLQRPRAEDLFR